MNARAIAVDQIRDATEVAAGPHRSDELEKCRLAFVQHRAVEQREQLLIVR